MSNPVAVIALTYRGADVQDSWASGAAAMFLEIIHGLNEQPSLRGSDTIVPSKVGRLQGSRVKDMVVVELQGLILGAQGATELSTYRAKATAFKALFDPTVAGSLVATLEDGTVTTLTLARTTNVLWDQLSSGLARVNVQLESPAGDWTVVGSPITGLDAGVGADASSVGRAIAAFDSGIGAELGSLPTGATFYGTGAGDTLANTILYSGGLNKVSFRFIATSTQINSVRWYFMSADGGGGYGNGNGGDTKVSLQSDDGSGNPSGTVLASHTYAPIGATSAAGLLTTFDSPAAGLTLGATYHVVFEDVDASPSTNNCSPNALYTWDHPSPTLQPQFSNTWAVMLKSGAGSWGIRSGYFPIMDVVYNDGSHGGFSYMEYYPTTQGEVDGVNWVRELFTVSGGDKTVTSVSIRGQKPSGTGTGNLSIRLEDNAGAEIETVTLPASTFPNGTETDSSANHQSWGTVSFASSHVLANGVTYRLVLSTPAGTNLRFPAMRQGSGYGYTASTYFGDGKMQSSSNSGGAWSDFGGTTERDLQFCFNMP